MTVGGSAIRWVSSLNPAALPLFEPPAVEALFQATQGMPRKVNRLAHYALTSAAIDKARTVTAEHVQAAREEVAP